MTVINLNLTDEQRKDLRQVCELSSGLYEMLMKAASMKDCSAEESNAALCYAAIVEKLIFTFDRAINTAALYCEKSEASHE